MFIFCVCFVFSCVCVFLSGHFFGSGRGNDRLEVVTKKSHYFFFESIIVMSNPVVFFDMEIGGQPAGRIEMTVRLLANTPFPFLGKNTTTLSDLSFFF